MTNLRLTYEVQVTINDTKVESSELEKAIEELCKKFGEDVSVNETDAEDLDEE